MLTMCTELRLLLVLFPLSVLLVALMVVLMVVDLVAVVVVVVESMLMSYCIARALSMAEVTANA